VTHGYPTLVAGDAVLVPVVELVDLDLIAVADGAGVELFEVPAQHLPHVVGHGLGAQLRRAP